MTAVRRDLSPIKQARDVTLQFEVEAEEGQTLDGAEIHFQMARHMGSTEIPIQKSIGNGITVIGDLTFDVEIDAEDTQDMEGFYYYEVRVTSDGELVTSTYGFIEVEDSLMGVPSS